MSQYSSVTSSTPMESSCQPEELVERSIVDMMVDIERARHLDNESTVWIESLKCLSVKEHARNVLILAPKKPRSHGARDFVAVSYPCESKNESERAAPEGLRLETSHGTFIKNFSTRDIVRQRVLNYTDRVRTPYFWIDQECVKQNDPLWKQTAIDSMHLVYSLSRYPVALLEVILTAEEVRLLSLLMSEDIGYEDLDEMIGTLEHIKGDPWWDRAFTFQEEYLAASRMRLLIRHEPAPAKSEYGIIFGHLENELCISASKFRYHVTRLLLELLYDEFDDEPVSEELKDRCPPLLEIFSKYTTLYEDRRPGDNRAMSSMIFEDVMARNISDPWDLLTIVANVCDYDVRLDRVRLEREGYCIEVCLLALYLVNGEIVFNDARKIADLPDLTDLPAYLNRISFNRFHPPRGVYELSWLKKCRLQVNKFTKEGRQVKGYLWHIRMPIDTSRWRRLGPGRETAKAFGLNTYQRRRLDQLIRCLQQYRGCKALASKLRQYLKEDRSQDGDPKESKRFMNLMAEEVVEAIRDRQTLYLAALEGSDEPSGIFVADPERAGVLLNSWVFTSWSARRDDAGRRRERHVSLMVRLNRCHDPPLMTIRGWLNGLLFFRGQRQKPAIDRWPKAWKVE